MKQVDGLEALEPVGRETVQDRTYRQLRDALIRGAFDAGEAFVPGDVAQRLGVSSMPVREALARLVSERALETMANRRVRVPLLTLDRARDITRARVLVEGELTARALPNLTRADVTRLEALTTDYEAAGDAQTVAHLNQAFHFSIYARAGSSVLLPVVESLWMQAGPFVRAAVRRHDPAVDAAPTVHHRAIMDAVLAHDAAAAVQALEADITQAFRILERAGDNVWDAAG